MVAPLRESGVSWHLHVGWLEMLWWGLSLALSDLSLPDCRHVGLDYGDNPVGFLVPFMVSLLWFHRLNEPFSFGAQVFGDFGLVL